MTKFHLHFQISFVLLVVGILIGVFAAAQLRSAPTRVTNPILPYASLKEANSGLETESEKLKGQVRALNSDINTKEQDLKNSTKVSDSLLENLDKAKENAGLLEISGQGVQVRLEDAPSGQTSNKIITAADIRDVINTLWLSGAQAIAINSERLVITSSVDAVMDSIYINKTKILPPFIIYAMGDPVKLKSGLINPDNLTDLHKRVEDTGIKMGVTESKSLTVPAYSGALQTQFAKIEKTTNE